MSDKHPWINTASREDLQSALETALDRADQAERAFAAAQAQLAKCSCQPAHGAATGPTRAEMEIEAVRDETQEVRSRLEELLLIRDRVLMERDLHAQANNLLYRVQEIATWFEGYSEMHYTKDMAEAIADLKFDVSEHLDSFMAFLAHRS